MKLTDLFAQIAENDAVFLEQIPAVLDGPHGAFLTDEQKEELLKAAAAEAKKKRK
jgi:hypothetical protein